MAFRTNGCKTIEDFINWSIVFGGCNNIADIQFKLSKFGFSEKEIVNGFNRMIESGDIRAGCEMKLMVIRDEQKNDLEIIKKYSEQLKNNEIDFEQAINELSETVYDVYGLLLLLAVNDRIIYD